MPLTLETPTAADVAAFARMADLAGEPLEHWILNRLNAAVTAEVRAQVSPHINEGLASAMRQLDAVDIALDENTQGMNGDDGASTVFGVLPVLPALDTVHARVKGSGQAPGPLATTDQVIGHPCTHLARRYLPGFNANDSQGTCTCPSRGSGESVCHWPAGAARNCATFRAKMQPVPNAHPMPRQG